MHYFKLNIGDYHKKAGRLTMIEHGAYTLLLHACYDRERFPTEEEALDWCWARTPEEVAAVKFVLSKFFDLVDGRYVQARIQEEIEAYHKKAETNRAVALDREARRRTKRAQDVNDSSPVGNDSPPNHKPLTTNQEPQTSVRPRASRLAQDWVLPDEWEAWAKEARPDLDVKDVADRFKDFWVAKAGKDGSKLDWQATWRNWVRNTKAQGFAPARQSTHSGFGGKSYDNPDF